MLKVEVATPSELDSVEHVTIRRLSNICKAPDNRTILVMTHAMSLGVPTIPTTRFVDANDLVLKFSSSHSLS